MEWYLKVVRDNYANFNGRARRKEYWMFALVNMLISIVLYALMFVGVGMESTVVSGLFGILFLIYAIATLVPSIAVMVRRLHDTGKSGWWYFIAFIPLVGGIALLVFLVTDGEAGTNQYGANPKTGGLEIEDNLVE